MTRITVTAAQEFSRLKQGYVDAVADLAERETEALRGGQQAVADALFRRRTDLLSRLVEIRLAERAYLASSRATDDAEARLRAATAEAGRALEGLQRLNSALESAGKLLSILTSLVSIFR